MRSNPRIAALVTLLTLGGCVSPQARLVREASPTASTAYVGAVCKRDTMAGFVLGLLDGQGRKRLLDLDGMGLIEVPPGKYRVAYWQAYAYGTKELIVSKDVPEGSALGRSFEVAAGQVELVGMFVADRSWRRFTIAPMRVTRGQLADELHAAYPAFAGVEPECVLCDR